MSKEKPSRNVVEAVAERAGVAPIELEPKLYTVVDPDALDRLFSPTSSGRARADGLVVIQFDGFEVTVGADGTVSVEDR